MDIDKQCRRDVAISFLKRARELTLLAKKYLQEAQAEGDHNNAQKIIEAAKGVEETAQTLSSCREVLHEPKTLTKAPDEGTDSTSDEIR